MALGFDLPREELNTYSGTNPRPDDFDAFWETALAEMDAVNPEIEITPAAFQVPFASCSDLWFTGVGGARVHAKLLQPKNITSPGPAVLMFHGYTSYCGDWAEKLNYVAAGFTVAALDCRGQGGLSEDVGSVKGTTVRGHIVRGLDDVPEKLLFRSVFLDTAQLAKIVMDMPGVDASRIGAMGGSQGGGLTLACAALEPRIKQRHPFTLSCATISASGKWSRPKMRISN
ncbi:acetylxylan esterase [Pontiellaceae bacterium B12219]|nr:acetylxylan esterase [Pontiellaceae bacterium B12219]